MQASELFNQPNTILLDGGMGTMLQAAGMKLGTRPEDLNIENPELIRSIHAKYAAAGSRVVNANTFGASPHKLADSKYTLEEVITAGIANCKQAVAPYGALVTLDVGPLGELLEPSGTLAFEDAVAEYGRIVRAGVAAGADILYFETFTDLYEMKAALLAAKENSTLPIMASMSFEANGRTFTGCTVESFAATARGLGANAVGINCSLGPKEIFPMAKRLAEAVPGDFPVFVKPNAGLPRADGSGYDITPQLYAMQMKPYRELHLFAAGGCCGTTPEFIQMLNGVFADCKPGRPEHPMLSVICSPVDCVNVDGITVVGERINPTGKKRLQQALREGDSAYACAQAVAQAEAGAELLDVNAGLPDIDEPATLETAVNESARQYVHDGTVALARTGNPQQVPARVNGVIADGTDTPTIYVNATTLQRYWPQAWEPDGLTILVHPNEGVDDQHAKTVLDDLLSDVETGSISSWNRSDNADDYEQVIGFLQLGVTVTAILLLSVSAIGMINIGLAGIEQCSHELLIRRALGATRASIAIQVIGSSVLLGLIIAFAAVLISAVLVWAIPWMMPADSPLEPPAYPYTAAMIAACASIVTSLVGSLAPAIKAIRLQPALALR